jgi:hypothetical protein
MEPAIKQKSQGHTPQSRGEEGPSRGRGVFKFFFWTAVSVALFAYAVRAHVSGQLSAWYYHKASASGYAVNSNAFNNATPEDPALLTITTADRLEGLMAVRVQKGDLLPANANGVIGDDVLKAGKRVSLANGALVVKVPWEIKTAKGVKFKDTFKHKGVETYPWGAAWNVAMVIGLGLALGFMAEGFTDAMGMKFEKIQHHGH